MKTIRQTTGTLSAGTGRAADNLLLDIPEGLRVRPCDDGSGEAFVEDYEELGLSDWHRFDAKHRGIRVPMEDCV